MRTRKTLVINGEATAINLRMPKEVHQQIKAKASREQKSITLVQHGVNV